MNDLHKTMHHIIMALRYASRVEQGIFLDELLSECEDCIMRADGLFTAIKKAQSGCQDDINRLEAPPVIEMVNGYIGVVK